MQMAAYIAKFAAIFFWFVWLCSNVQTVDWLKVVERLVEFRHFVIQSYDGTMKGIQTANVIFLTPPYF